MVEFLDIDRVLLVLVRLFSHLPECSTFAAWAPNEPLAIDLIDDVDAVVVAQQRSQLSSRVIWKRDA